MPTVDGVDVNWLVPSDTPETVIAVAQDETVATASAPAGTLLMVTATDDCASASVPWLPVATCVQLGSGSGVGVGVGVAVGVGVITARA